MHDWLSDSELERLQIPYRPWEGAHHGRRRIIEALGQPMPHTHSLASLLISHLVDAQGIPWLSGRDDLHKHLLISDYTVAAAEAVEISMVDAILAMRRHSHLRAGDAGAELEKRLRTTAEGEHPPLLELAVIEAEREFSSFFTAIGSALDRLMVPLVVLSAAPLRLRRLTWGSGYSSFVTDTNSPSANPERLPATEMIGLPEVVQSVGPSGWLRWALAMRNTVVHRPRRLTISVEPGKTCAPRDPDKSDVEVGRDRDGLMGVLLTESAEQVMAGILVSTRSLTEVICERLGTLALRRSRGDIVLTQPVTAQWPGDGEASSFEGYVPGSIDFAAVLDGRPLVVHPNMGRRMRAAGIMDDQRSGVWG